MPKYTSKDEGSSWIESKYRNDNVKLLSCDKVRIKDQWRREIVIQRNGG